MENVECKIEKQNSLFNFTFDFFKFYSWIIFLLIFIYLLFRAAFLPPLHDESATFLLFIEPECVVCDGIVQDANNHLLNSYLGTFIYHFAGDHFFWLRLPNVCAFALYFWGIYLLVKPIEKQYFKIIFLTALVSVAYMDDYFAYTRGYGLAISFFIWMLIFSICWLNDHSIKNAVWLYVFSLLAVFSNLVFMVSACLAMAVVGLIHLKNIRNWKLRRQLLMFLLHLLFLAGLYPFVWFSYMLKTGGALYYGSLNGFWEVTGKTLSRYVLFYDADWQRWLWMLLILAFTASMIWLAVKKGFWQQLKEQTSVFGWYFLGNIVAIFLLAKIFNVNYPEDRAGMYFIPLTILLFGFSVWKTRKLKPLILLLLFFPFTFLLKLSLSTSVFTPDERLSRDYCQTVKQILKPDMTFAVYPTMQLNWALSERKSRIQHQPDTARNLVPLYDLILNKKVMLRSADLSAYELIFDDKASGNVAYRRKTPLQRIPLGRFHVPDLLSKKAYIGLLDLDISDTVFKGDLLASCSASMKVDSPYRSIQVFFETFGADGKKIRSRSFEQRWGNGKTRLRFMVSINHVLSQLSKEETKLRLYIWNPEHHAVSFEAGETRLFKLKDT